MELCVTSYAPTSTHLDIRFLSIKILHAPNSRKFKPLIMTMKVLLTGASGTIGKEVLNQCLVRPDITSVVAFSRRELPAEVTSNKKLEVVILKDFKSWPQETLERLKTAEVMLWWVFVWHTLLTIWC